MQMNSGNILCYRGNEDNKKLGVRFIIHKSTSNPVQTVEGLSNWVSDMRDRGIMSIN